MAADNKSFKRWPLLQETRCDGYPRAGSRGGTEVHERVRRHGRAKRPVLGERVSGAVQGDMEEPTRRLHVHAVAYGYVSGPQRLDRGQRKRRWLVYALRIVSEQP